MTAAEIEPFIGKRVVIAFDSGLQEWGTLRYWDGAEVADRRLFLDNPPNTEGIWVAPSPFRPGDIATGGIRPFEPKG